MEHNAQGRRPHFHRGRRGGDRRGSDRRVPQAADQGSRPSGDVDVEQIMRDIRARIAQRSGIELSTTQITELAARRLEAVLDPKSMSPALTEQLRRGAGTPTPIPLPEIEGGYRFEHTTLYESHRGLLRLIRRMLNPILKLFFNPNPLIQALNTQARLNHEAAVREAERERRQAEWNALHYEIVNRMVTEVSRVSVEMQALAGRIESLTGRIDYADRRVRTLESAPAPRQPPQVRPEATAPSAPISPSETQTAAAPAESAGGEGSGRRKRRRRRGRRSGGAGVMEAGSTVANPLSNPGELDGPDVDGQDDDDADGEDVTDSAVAAGPADEPVTPAASSVSAPEPVQAAPAEPVQPAPPPDEPSPAAPVDHPDPGPPDR